ncbi:MAG: hypothetical protein JST12_17975 [Armatimonadetes bacterium]|nr:hypothetical protein [Armatimonadota bacterium]
MNANAILTALGIWTLMSSGVLAVAWAITRPIKGRAALRHLVWLTAFVALAAMPILTLVLPGRIPTKPVAAPTVDIDPAVLTELLKDAKPLPQPFNWSPVALGLWVLGIAFIAAKAGLALTEVRRMKRNSNLCQPESFGLDDQKLRRKWQLRVSLTRKPPAALTWGTLRPVVLFPQDATSWTPDRADSVLLHELAHVRRLDSLTQLLSLAVAAVYWFNPLVWMAAKALRSEAEIAADDYVVKSGKKPSDYASELLRLATEVGPQRQPLSLVGVSIMKQTQIERRIQSIVDPSNRRRGVAGLEGIAILVVVASVTVALASMRPAPVQMESSLPIAPTTLDKQTAVPIEKPIAEVQLGSGNQEKRAILELDHYTPRRKTQPKEKSQKLNLTLTPSRQPGELPRINLEPALLQRSSNETLARVRAILDRLTEQGKLTKEQRKLIEEQLAVTRDQEALSNLQRAKVELEYRVAKEKAEHDKELGVIELKEWKEKASQTEAQRAKFDQERDAELAQVKKTRVTDLQLVKEKRRQEELALVKRLKEKKASGEDLKMAEKLRADQLAKQKVDLEKLELKKRKDELEQLELKKKAEEDAQKKKKDGGS